ncbi:hypothetical protein N0V94_007541 [Neodidymelliopsis sp. IMI 364377]|nr:hypothetical protein N0V94_007541 [Neodidymelliopsis sp. IMI 364377]
MTGRLMDHCTCQNGRRSQRPTPQRQDSQVDAETYDCFFGEDTSGSPEVTTKACKDFSDEDMDSISEVTAEAYKDFFDQNMSGSLSGSMSSYMSAEKMQELPEIIVFAESLEIHGFSPNQKPYAYPPEIYTEDHSDDEYLSLFASFQDVAES